jgi:hypothetical protein
MLRCFSYHFMDDQRRCIFRFDTHGDEQPIQAPCHIHLGEAEEILENGDARLRGFDLEEITFLSVFRLAHRHINSKGLPWE